MYQEITAVQYERLNSLLPVVTIKSVDGGTVTEGIAIREEVRKDCMGTVFYIAFRRGDQYYFTEAHIRERNSGIERFKLRQAPEILYRAYSALRCKPTLH